ncbi:MAG: phage major capsid protein [Aquamicrobium sp.]|uniref:phage major capsid protein n=1 Tax=Aquamicrobium sp. TaxID=1872579 RepID=UPI00349EE1B8|nr:phage major capsid protein [Aquamicrobium sp.]
MPEPNLIEVRHLDLECRFTSDETGIIEGIASRWNELDAYGDLVQPGAFTASLVQHRTNGTMPAMLWLHGQPCGAWEIIEERSEGLYVRGRFALSTTTGRQAYEHAKAGTTTGLSIGFQYLDAEPGPGGAWIVRSVELHEISLTPTPAAPRARITQVRSQGTNMPEPIQTPAPAPAVEAITAEQFRALQDEVRNLTTALDEAEVIAQRGTVPPRPVSAADAETELRALSTLIRTGDFSEVRAATSSSDPEGGYFILPTVDTTIRNLLADVSPLRGLADVVTINSNAYERFYSTGNRGAQWVGETTERPQDTARPQLIKHSYNVMEMYAAPAGTRHLFEDASFDVAGWFNTWVANDFALSEGEAFLRGDGIGGKPRGVATYPIVATGDATRAWGEMQYIPAGHASAPTDDNWAKALVKLVLTLHPRFRANAAFVMNNATLIRIREIQDSNKRFMWSDHGNLGESAESGYLLGYPVHIDNNMDDIGSDKFPIAFGDFRQGYVVVDRQGIRIERDAVTQKGIILLDTYARVGGGLGDSRAIKWMKVAAA